MPALKLCVFDLDGTLVDSQHRIVAAMTAGFAAEGQVAPMPDAVRQVVGLPLDVAIRRLAPGIGGLQIERLVEAYRDAYFDPRNDGEGPEPLFPGTRQMLDAMEADGWLLAIVTGKSRRGLLHVLDAHGIRQRFVSLKSADDGPGKPNPTVLLEAMAEAGCTGRRTVMVGDTSFDMETAVNAEVAAAIGVSWGYHDAVRLQAAGSVIILDRFDQLPSVADGLVASQQEE
ncbi:MULTISPECIES: HAD-IA family hydrolase [Thalassobaculum]|uniref:Phosphoglycolate phosphatase n=1 Tax=Thalassobaculum litoreum DSM 18839 TaxID=1123362 RepID=A0A8G2BLZ5_9PROT|nr:MULTISPECIES: HAD-IA family hydrolase [Thalassobaculum]SDG47218.1 phosphoglycolate phosphatase [Thalassobaculum litoreum DSM 18839]